MSMLSSSSEGAPEVKNTLLDKRTMTSSNNQSHGTEKGDYTPLLWCLYFISFLDILFPICS